MTKKIKEIPPEIKAQFPEIVKKAIAQGLSCEPADRPRAEKAIRQIYKNLKFDQVPIVWVNSPIVGAFAAGILQQENLFFKNGVTAEQFEEILNNIKYSKDPKQNDILRAKVKEVITPLVKFIKKPSKKKESFKLVWHNWRAGQFWISWNVSVNTILKFIPYDKVYDNCELEYEIAQSAGYYWPNKNFIIMCERPKAIHLNGEGRLHNPEGPAISYGPEFELFVWNGVTIPGEWITNKKSLTAEIALKWVNTEQRRVACEILGWNNILNSLNSVVVDKDPDPQIGELIEVDLPDQNNNTRKERFLRVLCGTGREFALPVPPEMKTAIQAQSWTWGLDMPEFVKPEVRT